MMGWAKAGFALSTIALAQLLAGCGSSDPAASKMELQAVAQAEIDGMQAKLDGQFEIEMEGGILRRNWTTRTSRWAHPFLSVW